MSDQTAPAPDRARRISRRGQATRQRIVEAAEKLMFVRGVNATTLDDVREASQTSKSQLYQYFPDKTALVRAVVQYRGELVLEREHGRLQTLKSFAGLVRWRNALVQANDLQSGAYGCGLGSMVLELSDQDEPSRTMLATAFGEWEGLLAAGLDRMREAGALRPDADPQTLAVGLMAALQGGYLLANAAHDVTPMAVALDMALAHVRSFLVGGR